MTEASYQTERATLFSTPIFAHQWNDITELNVKILEAVLSTDKTYEKLKNSNSGGWQTPDDILSQKKEPWLELRNRVEQMLKDVVTTMSSIPIEDLSIGFRIDGWANVIETGGYNIVHSHPNALLSGVYYVSSKACLDDNNISGKIEFIDPRAGTDHYRILGLEQDNRQIFQNRPGLMLMFPGWLKHMVHPHTAIQPRVSIAFNIVPVGLS